MISVLVLDEAKWSDGCWDEERTALSHLKSVFRFSRTQVGSDCCHWNWGWVQCDVATRRVIRLSLYLALYHNPSAQQFTHLFNASLFLPFQDLRILDLSHVGLVGYAENEGFEKLSKLRHLQVLNLTGNHLNHGVLPSLSQVSTLRSLNLAGNTLLFTAPNPTQVISTDVKLLSRLTSLEMLDLSGTYMTNNHLLYLGGFSSLSTLILKGNYLQGTLHLQDIDNLKKLDLSENGIESLQSSHGSGIQLKLVDLEELDLSFNRFGNNIWAELGGFLNLKSLNISWNEIFGSIDLKEFCGWSNLESLDLSRNEVNQFVTSTDNRCLKKLRFLYLDTVSTRGSTSLASLLEPFPSVKTLFLRYNYFSNETVINQQLNVLRNVENLIMDYTPLPINFLESIGILTSLRTLSLYDCGLTGTLPAQGWCHLKSLEEVSLKRNALGGAIPSCLGNLTSLRYLDISGNSFTGNVASTPLTNLSMLQLLSFSYNQFQVPSSFKSFANLSNLKVLLAGGNKFVAEAATSQTWSPKFQLRLLDMSDFLYGENCEIDGHPNFLHYQHDLRYIDLSCCSYGGTGFPHWLVQNNTRLEDLHMINSSIVGPLFLPSHPNPNLKALDIGSNRLQHEIPRNFCSHFPNLESLYISSNVFNGKIPVCLGGMRSLAYLDMSFNNLYGGIPEQLAMSSSLLLLDLDYNKLSGRISPTVCYFFNSLGAVMLRANRFEGEIPDFSTISSTNLQLLDVSDNHFSGKLPTWLWSNTYFWVLDLSINHFEGSIPMGLCNLVYLGFLDLSENQLSGTLPSCSNLQHMQHVHLRKNKLSGPLSPAFNGSSSLVTLDLSENNLTGNIPDWVSTLPTLSVLLLKANQFDGGFPVHFCRLSRLSILDLSHNKLSGHLPSCLATLTFNPSFNPRTAKSTTYPIYNYVMFSAFGSVLADIRLTIYELIHSKALSDGELPRSKSYFSMYEGEPPIEFSTKKQQYKYAGTILELLSAIDLSCNQLTGMIPPALGNLSEIRGLNLSHNNLFGTLPSTFSNLKQTESLDLSYNNLNGRIPSELTELTALEVFSVTHNNLSGPLPDRKAQFGTFDESSYEGNPLLCGPPLNKSCSEGHSSGPPSASSSEEEHGPIDMGELYISFAVSYGIIFLATVIVLYINPYWRRVCFYFIEDCSTTCYYFIVDCFRKLLCFRRNI